MSNQESWKQKTKKKSEMKYQTLDAVQDYLETKMETRLYYIGEWQTYTANGAAMLKTAKRGKTENRTAVFMISNVRRGVAKWMIDLGGVVKSFGVWVDLGSIESNLWIAWEENGRFYSLLGKKRGVRGSCFSATIIWLDDLIRHRFEERRSWSVFRGQIQSKCIDFIMSDIFHPFSGLVHHEPHRQQKLRLLVPTRLAKILPPNHFKDDVWILVGCILHTGFDSW